MRLAKYLASAGVASRRAAEELVRAGRVTVGGVPVTDPARDVGERDDVAFDGERIAGDRAPVVYALNKPAGVVRPRATPRGARRLSRSCPSNCACTPSAGSTSTPPA